MNVNKARSLEITLSYTLVLEKSGTSMTGTILKQTPKCSGKLAPGL